MGITLRQDPDRRRLVARVTGTLTLDAALTFLRTARANPEHREWPLIFDARGAMSDMTEVDVDRAVAVVRDALANGGVRAHVAIIADNDELFHWLLAYETKCAELGVRVIRVFRQAQDAERWLDVLSSARKFMGG